MLIKIQRVFQSLVADSLSAVILLVLFCLVITIPSMGGAPCLSVVQSVLWSLLFWWINPCYLSITTFTYIPTLCCTLSGRYLPWLTQKDRLPWCSQVAFILPSSHHQENLILKIFVDVLELLYKAEPGLLHRSNFYTCLHSTIYSHSVRNRVSLTKPVLGSEFHLICLSDCWKSLLAFLFLNDSFIHHCLPFTGWVDPSSEYVASFVRAP